MGYPRDLDQYADEELVEEITRRNTRRADDQCDYCGGSSGSLRCRMDDRHEQRAQIRVISKVNPADCQS